MSKSTTAPKGTVKTEVILGSAAAKLNTGIKALADMMRELGSMQERIDENILVISNQEDKMESLKTELKNLIAQNKIEIQQAYDSDKEGFVKVWLEENNSIQMDKDTLKIMEQKLQQAQDTLDAEVRKQVAVVTNSMTARHTAELEKKTLEFTAKEAQNTAALAQKEEKIKFLEEQVAAWKKALENEQDAGIKRAQASTIQQTFTGTK